MKGLQHKLRNHNFTNLTGTSLLQGAAMRFSAQAVFAQRFQQIQKEAVMGGG